MLCKLAWSRSKNYFCCSLALHICNLLTFILYQLVTADFLLTRSTRLHVLYKNVLLKIFAKFTENQLRQSLFYSNFLSKETTVLVISCEIVRIFSENLSHRTPLGDSFWLDCKSLIISIEGDEQLMKLSSEKLVKNLFAMNYKPQWQK